MNNETFDYELIDCGEFRRIERFGRLIIDRPCAQAHWKKTESIDWNQAVAVFHRPQNGAGAWEFKRTIPSIWYMNIGAIKVELRFSPQGQIGIFPEQYDNWQWILQIIKKSKRPLKILNLFAYTGIATLVVAQAGALSVHHIDGAKSSLHWGQKNRDLSGLGKSKIHWLSDDVLKFLQREVRRGNTYDGIILDPPAFGRGKGKADWRIDRDLYTCMNLIDSILSDQSRFVILTSHSPSLTSQEMAYYLEDLTLFRGISAEKIELKIPAAKGNSLPSSFGARILR